VFWDKTFTGSSIQLFHSISQKFFSVLFFIRKSRIRFTDCSTHRSFNVRVCFVSSSTLFHAFDSTFNVWHFIHLQLSGKARVFPQSSGHLFTTSIILTKLMTDCKKKSKVIHLYSNLFLNNRRLIAQTG